MKRGKAKAVIVDFWKKKRAYCLAQTILSSGAIIPAKITQKPYFDKDIFRDYLHAHSSEMDL